MYTVSGQVTCACDVMKQTLPPQLSQDRRHKEREVVFSSPSFFFFLFLNKIKKKGRGGEKTWSKMRYIPWAAAQRGWYGLVWISQLLHGSMAWLLAALDTCPDLQMANLAWSPPCLPPPASSPRPGAADSEWPITRDPCVLRGAQIQIGLPVVP